MTIAFRLPGGDVVENEVRLSIPDHARLHGASPVAMRARRSLLAGGCTNSWPHGIMCGCVSVYVVTVCVSQCGALPSTLVVPQRPSRVSPLYIAAWHNTRVCCTSCIHASCASTPRNQQWHRYTPATLPPARVTPQYGGCTFMHLEHCTRHLLTTPSTFLLQPPYLPSSSSWVRRWRCSRHGSTRTTAFRWRGRR